MEMTLGYREHFSGAIPYPKQSVPSACAHTPIYACFQNGVEAATIKDLLVSSKNKNGAMK